MKKKLTRKITLIITCSFFCITSRAQYWQGVGDGLNAFVFALKADTSNNILYAGGSFGYQDTITWIDTLRLVAQWNGSYWGRLGFGDELKLGMSSQVNALNIINNELIIGGDFNAYPFRNISSRYIAKWNGSTYSGLGEGFSIGTNPVKKILEFNGQIHAAGDFQTANPLSTNNYVGSIAKWGGTRWDSLGSVTWPGLWQSPIGQSTAGVDDMIEYNGELYAGGTIDWAGGVMVGFSSLPKWNGTVWSDFMSNPPLMQPESFAVYNNELFIGEGGPSGITHLYKFDGTTLTSVATIYSSHPNGALIDAMTIYRGELVVAGLFNGINGTSFNNIAKWNGSTWSSLGSGIVGGVNCLEVFNGALYVGGGITNAGGITVSNIARWIDTTTGINELNAKADVVLFPNPAKNVVTITSAQLKMEGVTLYSLLGEKLMEYRKLGGVKEYRLAVDYLPAGLYFIQVVTNRGVVTLKWVKS